MSILIGYLTKLLKYVPSNIGAIVGMVQVVVTFIREVCMLIVRLICPIIPGDVEKIVKKVRDIAQIILDLLEKLKNVLLGLGFKVS